jgi:hypothetical protein
MAQRVKADSLRQFQGRHKADTNAEIESGFSGAPSGFANIKSRSVR